MSSAQLHEAGFNSDWIEKALAHEQKGVRGVYNKAEYLAQRREMLVGGSHGRPDRGGEKGRDRAVREGVSGGVSATQPKITRCLILG